MANGTTNRVNRQMKSLPQIFVVSMTDKGLISTLCKDLLQIDKNKTRN